MSIADGVRLVSRSRITGIAAPSASRCARLRAAGGGANEKEGAPDQLPDATVTICDRSARDGRASEERQVFGSIGELGDDIGPRSLEHQATRIRGLTRTNLSA